jgi:methyl-accepting chemotaxis protein
MALQLLPILKAMPGLISATSGIIQSIGAGKQSAVKTDERVKRLEDNLLHTAEALEELATKVHALALSVEAQAEAAQLQMQRAKRTLAVAWLACGLAVAALVIALTR